jgi:hypothetical protein
VALGWGAAPTSGPVMSDLIFILATATFFAGALAYIRFCASAR